MKKSKIFCCVLSLLVYLNTLQSNFVYDDARAILQNGDILPSASWTNLLQDDFWGTPLTHNGSHKSYRPLCTLTFKLNYLISGFQPFGYHLVNLILHVISTHLFLTLAESMAPTHLSVLLSGTLFALHPVHCEAVAGVVGRADLLAAIFFILALLAYQSHCRKRDKEEAKRDETTVTSGSECDETRNCDKNGNVVVTKKMLSSVTKHSTQRRNKLTDQCQNSNANIYLLLTVAFAGCAMFSKEQGITVLGVCFVTDLVKVLKRKNIPKMIENRNQIVKSLFTLAAAAVCLLFIRAKVMGFSSPAFAKADNPASASESMLTRALTFSFLPVFNFWLLLCPSRLSFDWSMNAIKLIETLTDLRNFASLTFYGLLVILVLKLIHRIIFKKKIYFGVRQNQPHPKQSHKKVSNSSKTDLVVLSLSVMILSFIPATNLFFYVGFVVAERVLYIPSIGFCLLSGFSVARVLQQRRQMLFHSTAICLTAILILSLGLRTIGRNNDWRNEESLYKAGIGINPPKALGNLGNVLTQTGRYAQAEWSFRKALEFRPNMADVHYNLGVLLQQQHRLGEAVASYNLAIQYRPKLALAHLNLALSYAELNRKDEALNILLNIPKISDDGTKDPKSHVTTQVSAMFNAGRILLDMGRPVKALRVLQEAEERGRKIQFSSQQGILNLLGEAYQAANNTKEAERWYRAALTEKPDHIPAYLTYGKMLAKNKTRHSEAEHWFTKANEIAPEDPNVHMHYGFFLLDTERNLEAGIQFEKAVQIRPQDYESNFNAGVAFRLAGKNDLAEKFYRQALQLRPQDPSAHMNLGAMLHLVGKLSEAEERYLSAWKLNPGDAATRTNLERLHNIMRKKGLKIRPVDPVENV